MSKELRFVLPFPNVSLNHSYRRRGGAMKDGKLILGARALTDAARNWKVTVSDTTALAAKLAKYEIPATEGLGLWVLMYPPDRRQRDVDGILKHTVDGIAKALNFHDSRIVDLRVRKILDFNVSPRLVVRLGVAASVPCQECGWW